MGWTWLCDTAAKVRASMYVRLYRPRNTTDKLPQVVNKSSSQHTHYKKKQSKSIKCTATAEGSKGRWAKEIVMVHQFAIALSD